jgi:hypothetical protein
MLPFPEESVMNESTACALSCPVLLWMACIYLGGKIGIQKDDVVRGLVWTALIGPIGLIVILATPPSDPDPGRELGLPRFPGSPQVQADQPNLQRKPERSTARMVLRMVLLIVGGLVLMASLAAFIAGMSMNGSEYALWPLGSAGGVAIGLVLLAAGMCAVSRKGRRQPCAVRKEGRNTGQKGDTTRYKNPWSRSEEMTKLPKSRNCPKCQGIDFKTVKPERPLALTDDRECKSCGTRYTP